MTFPTHVSVSLLASGVAGMFAGWNILQPAEIIVCTAAAILPDIDRPNSMARVIGGRWISQRLFSKFGHRTLTHSFLFWFVASLFAFVFCGAFNFPLRFAAIFSVSLFVHPWLDMLTLQGVLYWYPVKNPCVLIENPSKRLENGTLPEYFMLALSCAAFVFFSPNFQQSANTNFNAQFHDCEHLAAEFAVSKDLLFVFVEWREGSEIRTAKGYAVEANAARFVLCDSLEKLRAFGAETGLRVFFKHSKLPFTVETVSFFSVSADSLNRFFSQKKVLEIVVDASRPFVMRRGGIETQTRSFSEKLPGRLFFAEPSEVVAATINDPGPRIDAKRREIESLKNLRETVADDRKNDFAQAAALRIEAAREKDIFEKTKLLKAADNFEKDAPNVPDIAEKAARIESEIELLKAEKQKIADKAEPLRLSGWFRKVDFKPETFADELKKNLGL